MENPPQNQVISDPDSLPFEEGSAALNRQARLLQTCPIPVQNDPDCAPITLNSRHLLFPNWHQGSSIGYGEKTMHFTQNTATVVSEVRSFVMSERRNCVSDREWKFRLRGYGYDIRMTERGNVVNKLPQGQEVCVLD